MMDDTAVFERNDLGEKYYCANISVQFGLVTIQKIKKIHKLPTLLYSFPTQVYETQKCGLRWRQLSLFRIGNENNYTSNSLKSIRLK